METYKDFEWEQHVCLDGTEYQPRPWGREYRFRVVDKVSGEEFGVKIPVRKGGDVGMVIPRLEEHLDRAKEGRERKTKVAREFAYLVADSIHDDYIQSLRFFVEYARENPGSEAYEAISAHDEEYPSSMIKGSSFVHSIKRRTGMGWSAFKSHASSKLFEDLGE